MAIKTSNLVLHLNASTGFNTPLNGTGYVVPLMGDHVYNNQSYVVGPNSSNNFIRSRATGLTNVNITQGSFTIEAWINPEIYIDDFSQILCQDDTYNAFPGFQFRIVKSTRLLQFIWFPLASRGSSIITSTTEITLSQWNHVSISANTSDNTIRGYINGVKFSDNTAYSISSGGTTNTSTYNIGVGHSSVNTSKFTGQIGIIRAYNVALTDAEILENYNTEKSTFPIGTQLSFSWLTPTAAVSSQLISAQATTSTPLIDPILSSIYRVSSNIAISQNFNINNLDSPVTGNKSSVPGLLTGRRPKYGQLFPRGYYNR